MDPKGYYDFDLLVERVAPGYRIHVVECPVDPAGRSYTDLGPLPDFLNSDRFLATVGRSNRAATRDLNPVEPAQAQVEQVTKRFGTQLFDSFFSETIKELLHRSCDAADRKDKGLRLRLRLTDVPELGQLPWEFLYDSDLNRFLTLYTETPVVRYPELSKSIDLPRVKPPFKILVASACPTRLVQLGVDQEFRDLEEALASLVDSRLVEVQLIKDLEKQSLLERIEQEDFHVFHFIGHGDFDPVSREGFLVMQDESKLTMEELGIQLRERRGTLRLVILNACKGARTSAGDPFDGLAQRLIQEQIPAVIAMQFAISDQAAIAFAREFYGRLADRVSVECALAWARKAICLQGNKLEWATPVLFMRSPSGQIFGDPDEDRRLGRGVTWMPDEPAPEQALPAGSQPECVECFVDREKQYDRFVEMIEGNARQHVMFVKAPEEMGKTWLIERFRHECLKRNTPVARIDFELGEWSHLHVVFEIRSQLGKDRFPRLTQFMNDHPSFSLSISGDVQVLHIPPSGSVREVFERQLTDAFFEDLRSLSRDRVIVLLFDTYEEASRSADQWLRGELLSKIRDTQLPRIMVVLAGREVPDLRSSWRVHVAETDLACFDDDHVEQYLQLQKIASLAQPLQSSGLCTKGRFVPGELATEITREKGAWL